MNLAQSDNGPWLLAADGTELRQESCAVAFDCAARVLFSKSKIEGVAAIRAGESTGSRAESMNQPWNPSKNFRTQNIRSSLLCTLGWHQTILTIPATVPQRRRSASVSARIIPVQSK